MKRLKLGHTEAGSMALEYVLISAFAAIVALASITYVSDIIKRKIDLIEDRVGIEFSDDLNLFNEP